MIPYNPSSFDRNKTILEQIIELKNWLKDHPSYQIFYSSENGNNLAFTGYLLSAITDPTNLAVGDVVIFSNVMVGVVTSVDTDNGTYGCDPCVSFKGATGPVGQAGRSIRVSSENYVNDSTAYSRNNIQPTHTISQYDLVIFANDYLGYVSNVSGINFYVIQTQNIKGADGTNGTNGTNGEDGAYVSNATVDGNGDLQITIYDPATSTSSTINAGHVVGPQGSGIQIVALTSTSGTLSADDLSKVTGTDDCIITYTNAGATMVFKRASIDSSYAYFTNVVVDGDTYYFYAEVDVTTGQYNLGVDQLPIKASNINSGTATNGQVLTADGNGGASWQNAGGGGSKYLHIITLKVPYGSGGQNIIIHIINTDSTKYTTADACISAVATFLNSLTTPKKAFCGGYHSTSFSSTNAYNYAQGSSNTSFNSYYNSGASYDQWYTGMSIEAFGDSMIAL